MPQESKSKKVAKILTILTLVPAPSAMSRAGILNFSVFAEGCGFYQWDSIAEVSLN